MSHGSWHRTPQIDLNSSQSAAQVDLAIGTLLSFLDHRQTYSLTLVDGRPIAPGIRFFHSGSCGHVRTYHV